MSRSTSAAMAAASSVLRSSTVGMCRPLSGLLSSVKISGPSAPAAMGMPLTSTATAADVVATWVEDVVEVATWAEEVVVAPATTAPELLAVWLGVGGVTFLWVTGAARIVDGASAMRQSMRRRDGIREGIVLIDLGLV